MALQEFLTFENHSACLNQSWDLRELMKLCTVKSSTWVILI